MTRTTVPPLNGLVLSGGYSTRMGADKGGLVVAGRTRIEHALALLAPPCGRVFLSCRAEQASWPAYAPHPMIHDIYENIGPMGGILSAMAHDSQAAWLVLACDMPRVTPEVLALLVANRAPERFATAFTDEAGLPDPLCTIYEPGRIRQLRGLVATGQASPRRALQTFGFQAVPVSDPRVLQSVNAPENPG